MPTWPPPFSLGSMTRSRSIDGSSGDAESRTADWQSAADLKGEAGTHVAGNRCSTAFVADQPSMVLLHGVQSSRLTWWRNAQALAELGGKVHRLDLLGHGDRAGVGSGIAVDG